MAEDSEVRRFGPGGGACDRRTLMTGIAGSGIMLAGLGYPGRANAARVHGDDSSVPCDWTLRHAAAMLTGGSITSAELTGQMLARIAKYDPALQSFFSVMEERAMREAHAADEQRSAGKLLGPLQGIPIALKDNIDAIGAPTTVGMAIYKGRVASADAAVVQRLRNAGAVIIGKNTLPEGALFARNPELAGLPRNPWNREYWTGVSSWGSGISVAAGMCLSSLGTDTGGSIRLPAATNGVVGLKPTWGRVCRAGVFPLSPSLDVVGPLARDAWGAAAVLQAISGGDERDPTSSILPVPEYLKSIGAGGFLANARIGVDRALNTNDCDATVIAACDKAERALRSAGATIVEIKMPDILPFVPGSRGPSAAVAYSHRATFPSRADEYAPGTRGALEAGLHADPLRAAESEVLRMEFTGRLTRVLHGVDAVLTPAMPWATPTWAEVADMMTDGRFFEMARFTGFGNAAGVPALTLPVGLSDKGLPSAVQFVGSHFAEAALLTIAHELQLATGWDQLRPGK